MVFLLCGTYVYVCRRANESRRDFRGVEEEWVLKAVNMWHGSWSEEGFGGGTSRGHGNELEKHITTLGGKCHSEIDYFVC